MKQTKSRPNNLNKTESFRGYRFRDLDPVMEEIRGIITDSGLSPFEIEQKIIKLSGGGAYVSAVTVYRWLAGKVLRPQNYTIDWVARACGKERKWCDIIEVQPTKTKRNLKQSSTHVAVALH